MAFWNKNKDQKASPKTEVGAIAPKAPAPQPQGNQQRSGGWPGLAQVRHIIAVGSGKGGVGKSTVSLNLAVGLKQLGYKVGLLDADIYGPTQSGMMGHTPGTPPKMEGNQLMPLEKYGLKYMSMGVVAGAEAPVVWRAPMATKMITQFLNVSWGNLDFLIIDMPPGTGDVQITLAQQASLSGAVIVTTPQEVALQIASKGLKMFEQVNVPILGIVENMSGFTCAHCHEVTPVFKQGGGELLAKHLNVAYLGHLPLDPEIMNSGDQGKPILENGPSTKASEFILTLTKNLVSSLEKIVKEGDDLEPLSVTMDSEHLVIDWPAGEKGRYSPYDLRVHCSCASCVDENSGKKILDPKAVSPTIKINSARPVGRYGLALHFSDGHNTGIYKYEAIQKLHSVTDAELKQYTEAHGKTHGHDHHHDHGHVHSDSCKHGHDHHDHAPKGQLNFSNVPTENTELFKKVQELLKEQITPSLAQHGGNVELVKIEQGLVYLKFGGGCHGCSQVGVTVKDGIEKLLKGSLPEIQGIRDVTDHQTGSNPYFK